MGTWICHLRLAENLLSRIPSLDPHAFAIGNIAPDSGIPDENWQTFNPPKHITHFGNEDETWGIADLDFYRQYLMDVSPDDGVRYSFLLGYFFHLVTDNLWAVEIWRPHKEKYTLSGLCPCQSHATTNCLHPGVLSANRRGRTSQIHASVCLFAKGAHGSICG